MIATTTQAQRGNGPGPTISEKIVPLHGRRTVNFADEEAERLLLGILLYDESAVDEVHGKLAPAHFQIDKHRWIYQAIADLRTKGQTADLVTVDEKLVESGRLKTKEESTYLPGLLKEVFGTHRKHVALYVRRILKASMRAEIHSVLSDE